MENIILVPFVNGHALFVNFAKSLRVPKAQQVLRAAIQAISGTSGEEKEKRGCRALEME